MPDHYFAPQPSSEPRRRTIRVALAGRERLVTTAAGTFSPDRLDAGTAVLLDALPPLPSTGVLLDIGCGWGPIGLAAALGSPAATVYAIDVNARAIELAERNAAALGAENMIVCQPEQVPGEVRFSAILSNPPIHVGKAVLHGLLLQWLPRLLPGGTAWLVVQKHLGSDSLASWMDAALGQDYSVTRHSSKRAFRVLRVDRYERTAQG